MKAPVVEDWGAETVAFRLAGKQPIEHRQDATGIADELRAYARGHLGFYGWLRVADLRVRTTTDVGLLDLADRCWRDDYEGRVHPIEAADIAIDETAAGFGIEPP